MNKEDLLKLIIERQEITDELLQKLQQGKVDFSLGGNIYHYFNNVFYNQKVMMNALKQLCSTEELNTESEKAA